MVSRVSNTKPSYLGSTSTSTISESLSRENLNDQLENISQGFQSAQTTAELTKLVALIDSTTSEIDKTLNHKTIIDSRRLQNELSGIELNRAKLSSSTQTSSQLSALFSTANDLGHTLTFKIKSLDSEINKVKQTLDFVTDIQLLKNNINQAFYALEHKDLDTAAKCIFTIKCQISQELIDGQFASVVIPSTDIPQLPGVTLANWKKLLADEFTKNFNNAAAEKNIPAITKYFQLFPLIDHEEVGLLCYSKFICSIIGDTSRSLIGSIDGKQSIEATTGVYSSIASQLFENISMMLSQHGPLIKKYYGATYPGALTFVINKIQSEIDSQIGLISDTFYDIRRIDKVKQDISLYHFPILSKRLREDGDHGQQSQNSYQNGGQNNIEQDDTFETVSIVSVGDLVGELASILHYWALYCKFITQKYIQPQDSDPKSSPVAISAIPAASTSSSLSVNNTPEPLRLPALIESSNFTSKIHSKLLPSFEVLVGYYFRRSIEKAISIEELPSLDPFLIQSAISTHPDQPPVSSVIEDTTLVLNTSLRSVIDTSQPATLKHFITEAYKIIHQDLLIGYFMKSLRDSQPRYNSVLHLIQPPQATPRFQSPGSTRSSTPAPDNSLVGGGFFKGATSALGSVVNSTAVAAREQSPKLSNFILLLNTLAMGQEYFTKIFDGLTKNAPDFLQQNFPFGQDSTKVEQILKSEFLEPFIASTNKLVSENLIVLFNQSIKQHLARLVNEFLPDSIQSSSSSSSSSSSYLIYSSSALNDTTIISKTSVSWQTLIRPYKQTFHKALLYNKLLRLLVVNLANLIEKKLLVVLEKFKINELGSLKLEKDLSFFINEVCEDNYDLREKFIRVTQLVLLVGMDDDEYELSLVSTSDNDENEDYLGINWVLTPMERKTARQFRI